MYLVVLQNWKLSQLEPCFIFIKLLTNLKLLLDSYFSNLVIRRKV